MRQAGSIEKEIHMILLNSELAYRPGVGETEGKIAPYPVVPVEAADRKNHFWKNRNMINTGVMIIVAKAMTSPQRKGAWLKKAYNPTIRGR